MYMFITEKMQGVYRKVNSATHDAVYGGLRSIVHKSVDDKILQQYVDEQDTIEIDFEEILDKELETKLK